MTAALLHVLLTRGIGTAIVDEIGLADTAAERATALAHHRRNDAHEPPREVLRRWEHTTLDAGAPLHLLEREDRDGVVLYLHGGAYVVGPNTQQWRTAALLADGADRDLAVLDYGLAPEQGIEAAVAAATASLGLLAARYDEVLILADSAGGGLGLAAMQRARDTGSPQAAGAVLISPWLDATLADPQLDDSQDALLSIDGLRGCARLMAGGLPLDDPRMSPLIGDLAGLPPMAVYAGSRELLLPDAQRLHVGLKGAGGVSSLTVGAEMPHAYVLFFGREVRRARAGILSFLANGSYG